MKVDYERMPRNPPSVSSFAQSYWNAGVVTEIAPQDQAEIVCEGLHHRQVPTTGPSHRHTRKGGRSGKLDSGVAAKSLDSRLRGNDS